MEKKRIGVVLMILGLLLLIAAISVAVYNYRLQKTAQRYSDEIVKQFREMYNFPEIDEKITTTKEIESTKKSGEIYEKTISKEKTSLLNGDSYIGIIQIVSLDVELPVAESFSYDKLKKTPCRYSGTVSEGNLVICAHNYASHFGGFNKLVNGDIIRSIDFEGNVYTYSVASIEQIEPTNIDAVNDEDYALVLFTCNISGNARIIVKCDLI